MPRVNHQRFKVKACLMRPRVKVFLTVCRVYAMYVYFRLLDIQVLENTFRLPCVQTLTIFEDLKRNKKFRALTVFFFLSQCGLSLNVDFFEVQIILS